MYVKIRNWTGSDLTSIQAHLYKVLQSRTKNRVKHVFVKCFDYHDCLVVDTDEMGCINGMEVLLETICAVTGCDLTIKYKPTTFSLQERKEKEFLGCYPALEIWLNDGSQYCCETPDYEDDRWFD